MSPFYLERSGSITVTTLAKKLLRVTFDREVVVNDALRNIANYTITPVTANADDVSVVAIRGYNESFNEASAKTQFVDLEITQVTIGATYDLTVSNLLSIDSELLVDLEAWFLGRLSKFDSMISSLPKSFSHSFGNVLPSLLMAIGIGDEHIGGQGDFERLNIESTASIEGAQTYGSATFGTSTFGG